MSTQRTASQERWLRFFNETVYDVLPAAYNALDKLTFGVWWKLVNRALDYVKPGGRVLEVGFGPGRLHGELAKRAGTCAGLDLAWGMCHYTSRRLAKNNETSLITQGNALQLPYTDDTFDTVVSTFAISGMPEAAQIFTEIGRVLTPGGQFVLVDIGLPSDGNRAGTFWARLWERMGDFLYDQPALMQAAGLAVVTCEEFGPGKHIRAIVGQKK